MLATIFVGFVFIFGDFIGMPRKTEGLVDRLGAKRISISPSLEMS